MIFLIWPFLLAEKGRRQRCVQQCELFLGLCVRGALLPLVVLTAALPLKAAEPIRLQVIPYEAGWGSLQIPVHNFQGTLQAPPPLMPDVPTVEKKPRKRRPNSGRDTDWDWLMD